MRRLAVQNLTGKPVRTAVLTVLAALLALAVFGGSLIVTSLRTGLHSLEDRLGADIMVVPYEATTKTNLEAIVLQGATGYFYMDNARAEKVLAREGIGQASEQFFLASASTGCCSLSVQIIGFDPQTDFSITPWIRRSFGGELQKYDVVVGNDLNAFVGDTLQFYGTEVHVAAKLAKTGTAYDTAVFTGEDTIKALIASSVERGMNQFTVDPDKVVSCILINAADGYTPEEVVNDINIHVKKVKAIQTKEMISGISDSLSGVRDVIGVLMAAVWVLGLAILLLAFTMSVNERRKEFAVLRVIGASRGMLAGLVLREALLTGVCGGMLGSLIGLAVIVPFNRAIEEQIGLPFLLPGAGTVIGYFAAAVILTALAGAAAASIAALRISRMDTGLILRGDN
ncbi:MAG: FtsX-like permease family protein [Oscillospiraceae bacterium]|nr:FtsX-like permease family protein [Oscillospiraceae bacterium]